jgi:uncharacterized protein YkwD
MEGYTMKGKTNFIAGFVLGAAIFGGATALAASGVLATPVTSKVLVNDSEIYAEAYTIAERTYFQLNDMSKAIGFSAEWDGDTRTISIDTTKPLSPQVNPAPTATSATTIDEMKAEIVRLTNIERKKAGLPKLAVLDELMDCAQLKAEDMRDNHYYGHNSPTYGSPLTMITSFGITARGSVENIAAGRDTPEIVMNEWLKSDAHRQNILDKRVTYIGVGIIPTADGKSYSWVVQMIALKQ